MGGAFILKVLLRINNFLSTNVYKYELTHCNVVHMYTRVLFMDHVCALHT